MLKSKAFHTLLGIAISAGLIAWIAGSVSWEKVYSELRNIQYLYFIPLTASFLLHFGLRAWRWKYLLPPGKPAPLRTLFDSIMVGAFATFILPLRAGEFVRPWLLSQKTSIPFITGFVSVFVERFFDLSTVLISFGIVSQFLPNMPQLARDGALALSIIAAAIFILMIVGSFFPKVIERWAQVFFRLLPAKLQSHANKFHHDFLVGAAVLADLKKLFLVVIFSILVWTTSYLVFYVSFLTCGIDAGLGAAVTVGVIVALAVAAPSGPGFIGVFQAGCIAAFALYGLSYDTAVAYSIVVHLFHYVMFVVYGMYVLSHYQLRLSELKQA